MKESNIIYQPKIELKESNNCSNQSNNENIRSNNSNCKTLISPKIKEEIKLVLDKMDPDFFNHPNMIKYLTEIQLKNLSQEIKLIMNYRCYDFIPTKKWLGFGTMDMRYSVNKDLVYLFKK